ncbi:MAG: SAM-dependent chlorinase/fluorinase [Dissulfurispiraceae bacterium]|jgi:S-adenosylmethionine hydrolase|nr:SAM-dependent chlorinase/fluorinase [Dissulfurispiraceae bacterium]
MKSSEALKPKQFKKPSGIITITTDFGYSDSFASEMKGIILCIAPKAKLVDTTHLIEKHSIVHAAIVIDAISASFPSGTVHLVVVDPGVGSARRPIAIKADKSYFVGPDNGVFSKLLLRVKKPVIHEISEDKYVSTFDSSTFYGRDVFAPVAAHLSKGLDIKKLGAQITDPVIIRFNQPVEDRHMIIGEIEYIDGFGNAVSNIKCNGTDFFEKLSDIYVDDIKASPSCCYSDAPEGTLSCLVNSSGCLEFFVNQYSVAKMFELCTGSAVKLMKKY